MSRLITFVAATLIALGGCTSAEPAASPAPSSVRPNETPVAGDHKLTMDGEGTQRTYELHAPPSYAAGQKKLPLVVVMHYRDGNADLMRRMTKFDAKADREEFLVAYPNGLNGAMNALICCGSNDDVGFVKAMVQHLIGLWDADPARVYATGISNGADMAFRLAVEAPGMFAAIAPVSGGFLGTQANDDPAFKPSKPVSVIAFAGNDDRIVNNIAGGMRNWYRKLTCTESEPAWVDAKKTVQSTTAKCADGSETIFYVANKMGHAWPGGTAAGLGAPDAGINAVATMWTFFKDHRLDSVG